VSKRGEPLGETRRRPIYFTPTTSSDPVDDHSGMLRRAPNLRSANQLQRLCDHRPRFNGIRRAGFSNKPGADRRPQRPILALFSSRCSLLNACTSCLRTSTVSSDQRSRRDAVGATAVNGVITPHPRGAVTARAPGRRQGQRAHRPTRAAVLRQGLGDLGMRLCSRLLCPAPPNTAAGPRG